MNIYNSFVKTLVIKSSKQAYSFGLLMFFWPCLKAMSLGKEEVVMIEQGKLQIDLQKLSSLKLQCFDDEQVDVFPFVFGSKVSLSLPTIKKLGFLHCAFKEIFPAQAPGIDCTKILSQLKTLEFVVSSNLNP